MNNKKNKDEIVLSKEEIEQARLLIKSVISPKEKVLMYALAGLSAVADSVRKIIPQFASKSYSWLGGKLGSEFSGSSINDIFINTSVYVHRSIYLKMQNKILRDYDTRPEMEQKMLNPEKIANYTENMGECAGMYMMQNAKKWIGYTGVGVGAALTIGSLSAAALPMSLAMSSAAVMGGSAIVGTASYFILKHLKDKKVTRKDQMTEASNNVKSHTRQMLVNSQMRAKALANEQSYNSLLQKQQSLLTPTRNFVNTLNSYGVGLKAVELVSGAVTAGAALISGMSIVPALVLTAGVTTTVTSLNSAFSARLGLDEYKETFATMYKRYKRGIKDFVYGNESIQENANVLQIDNIAYRFRNKDEKSPLYGEYGNKTAFTSNADIRFGPGITLLSGASGAGKSTLITLLNHGDYVTKGAICIGTTNENGNFKGQDYRDLKHLEVNKNISFAEANPQLDMVTIDEYIRLGNPNADSKKVEAIKNMLEIVSEEPEIDKNGQPTGNMKPRRLDTISSDSSGEKARLSIAQALIKDSPIMIFDEPTSLLDKRMTNIVLSHFKELEKKGKTIIFTTHKPEDIDFLKPYQAVDIGVHTQDQQNNDIKKYDLRIPRNLENFISFFSKRQIMEKNQQKEKINSHLDHARNLIKKRLNEGTNESTNGISQEDLVAYKRIKGKTSQEAAKETSVLFNKIGKGVQM